MHQKLDINQITEWLNTENKKKEESLLLFIDSLISLSKKSNLKIFIQNLQRYEFKFIYRKILLKQLKSSLFTDIEKEIFTNLKFKIQDYTPLNLDQDYVYDFEYFKNKLIPFLLLQASQSIIKSDFSQQLDVQERDRLFKQFPISISFMLDSINMKKFLVINLSYLDFELKQEDLIETYLKNNGSSLFTIKSKIEELNGHISTKIKTIDKNHISNKMKIFTFSLYLPETGSLSPAGDLFDKKDNPSLLHNIKIFISTIYLLAQAFTNNVLKKLQK